MKLYESGKLVHVDSSKDIIKHFGVKGMRWGQRKVRETLNYLHRSRDLGNGLSLEARKANLLTRGLMRISRRARQGYNDRGSYNIRKDGKKVGELYVDNLGKGELNVNWVSVKKKYQGKGYAQRVMKEVDKIAKDGKHTHVTLEVPEISPNARHVYKKLGYKEGKTTKAEGWGTLTDMRKEIR
jgi:hypothetical protein